MTTKREKTEPRPKAQEKQAETGIERLPQNPVKYLKKILSFLINTNN